jgi:hypothetical protein
MEATMAFHKPQDFEILISLCPIATCPKLLLESELV